MTTASEVRPRSARRRPRPAIGLTIAAIAVIVIGVVGWRAFGTPGPPAPEPIAQLGTTDVHSLQFLPGSDRSLLFGSHDGVMRSDDGGLTWRALPVRADAMTIAADAGVGMVIAGHDVLQRSRDGGLSWSEMPTDLPNLDIHAFAQDASRPSTMWADVAGDGLYESRDDGDHWVRVFGEERLLLNVVVVEESAGMMGLDPLAGLSQSADGGRNWGVFSHPPIVPVGAFAVTPDGSSMVVGGAGGLARSDDRGTSWIDLIKGPTVLAAALSADGSSVVAVARGGAVYRFFERP